MKSILLPTALIRCLAAGMIFRAAGLWAATPSATPAKSVLVYYEDDDGASTAALQWSFASFNQLAADTYTVNARGRIRGTTFTQDLSFARSQHIQTFATVSNFGATDFDPTLAHAIIRSAQATNNFTAFLLRLMANGRYQGANIDFESVPAADRNAYTAFLRTVTARLHAHHYQVVVSVPAKLADDKHDAWTGAFNFAAIGRFVDVVQLMTYDENGPWGDPGPVAGLDWVEAAVQYAVTVVPPAKVSLGIPAYGYDWDLTNPANDASIPWNAIPPLLASTGATPQWDATSASPSFTYTLDGHDHVVWYENTASLQAKLALTSTYQLGGISVFALGMEDAGFWAAIASVPL